MTLLQLCIADVCVAACVCMQESQAAHRELKCAEACRPALLLPQD